MTVQECISHTAKMAMHRAEFMKHWKENELPKRLKKDPKFSLKIFTCAKEMKMAWQEWMWNVEFDEERGRFHFPE